VAVHLYLMPISGTGASRLDPRVPKYRQDLGSIWQMMDYGNCPVCLVASNVDDFNHAVLTSYADVWSWPENFQNNRSVVGEDSVPALRERLEQWNIPGMWIRPTDTWLDVAHGIGTMFQLMQRFAAVSSNADPFDGVALSTPFAEYPADRKHLLLTAATSMGFDTAGITGSSDLRGALKYLGDQWADGPLHIGGLTL
jgi:hypothetical protein